MREVREFLIAKSEAIVARHAVEKTDTYGFSAVLREERNRLSDLKAGNPTYWYGWQLPREVRPPDGSVLYEVSGTGIAPAQVWR